MRRRSLRILFAVLWFFWTGVIIPGHTRGSIPVAGSRPCGSCCASPQDKSKPDAPRSTTNCAICNLAAKLMPAVTFTVRLEPGELRELRTLAPAATPQVAEQVSPIQSRAPPSSL
ncbi:MAG TPA: hypothetical protein VH518_13915 [Tepidisphaeraceae bacterium]